MPRAAVRGAVAFCHGPGNSAPPSRAEAISSDRRSPLERRVRQPRNSPRFGLDTVNRGTGTRFRTSAMSHAQRGRASLGATTGARTSMSANETEAGSKRSAPPPHRRSRLRFMKWVVVVVLLGAGVGYFALRRSASDAPISFKVGKL